jgi:asparagine synthase (glutamine-hydrolysing)
MCRIAAIISNNKQKNLQEDISCITNIMHKGGPDDMGIYVNKNLGVALGHRRLSIIDLSANGHQPMIDNSFEFLKIVFNGEIYNYQELKIELQNEGYQFSTNSDTEVILKSYHKWGKSCVDKFKGMFAFIIVNEQTNSIFAARDHAGIKPLYYSKIGNEIYFASEIKAFKAIDPNWKENKNWKIWFLTYGFLPEPITTLENVTMLPRGHYMQVDIDTKNIATHQYYLYQYLNKNQSYKEAVAHTKHLVETSVKRHLIADVPVGVFLSGGIDSSILAIVAQAQNKAPIETLSVYFDDEKYSEKEFQEIIIKQTGVKHHLFKISQQDFEETLPQILESLDQPSVDAINTHFICKYANKLGLKVVLSGLGADELFGGYPSFSRSEILKTYQRLACISNFLPSQLLENYPRKKIEFLRKKIETSEYLLYRGLFAPSDTATILGISKLDVFNELKKLTHLEKGIDNLLPQNRASYLESSIYMQGQLLKDSDIQSMWFGLELRVPFLDIDLVSYINNLSPSVKYNNTKTKPLLVDAFIDVLPRQIWDRKKQGFTFPFQNWFKKMNLFANTSLSNIYFTKFLNGKINFSRLWSVFILEKFNSNN